MPTLFCEAFVINFLATSTLSTSTSDFPVSRPLARRNVYAMAPPISTVLAILMKFSINSILSEIFAPPTIATYGFSAFLSARLSASISLSIKNPAAACFTYETMPAVDACARCAAPKASLMYTSQSVASCLAKLGSFFSSSAWNRRFSSRSTSPSSRLETIRSTSAPTQSGTNCTGFSSNSLKRSATGFRLYFGSGLPLGRPRCDARMSRPPCCKTYRIEGSAASMRVSSVTVPSRSGTLKSTRINTRLPGKSRSEMESLFTILSQGLPHNELDQVAEPHAEAPFVVVPREDFQHPVPDRFCQRAVDYGRMRVVEKIGRNEFLIGVLHNPLQRALCSGLKSGVSGCCGDWFFRTHCEVDQ